MSAVGISNGKDTHLVVAEASKKIHLLEIGKYEPIEKDWVFHNSRITSVNFSPDNQFVMSTSNDRFVYFWSMKTLQRHSWIP